MAGDDPAPAQRRLHAGTDALTRRILDLPLILTAIGLFVAMPQPVAAHGCDRAGIASWYGPGFDGRRTASGEPFDQWAMTAAHRTLPFGTVVTVTYGDRSVEVRINDRGPAAWTGREIDLSRGAAERLGLIAAGVGQVCITW